MSYMQALRGIIERTGAKSLRELARQAGVALIYRVIVCYQDGRAHHSVATVYLGHPPDDAEMTLVLEGLFEHQPLRLSLPRHHIERLGEALRRANFDKLSDQGELAIEQHTLWCIERAIGGFHHIVTLSPHRREMPYTIITNAIEYYLPEAVREVER